MRPAYLVRSPRGVSYLTNTREGNIQKTTPAPAFGLNRPELLRAQAARGFTVVPDAVLVGGSWRCGRTIARPMTTTMCQSLATLRCGAGRD